MKAIMLAAILVISMLPTVAYGAHKGIDINTLPYPKAECISGANNGACYVAEIRLANGTMFVIAIDNSMLHPDDPTPVQTQFDIDTATSSGDTEDEGEGDEGGDTGDEGGSCYDDGYEDGRDNPFDSGGYNACGGSSGDAGDNEYYNGFVAGCLSVSGNTAEICEGATDN